MDQVDYRWAENAHLVCIKLALLRERQGFSKPPGFGEGYGGGRGKGTDFVTLHKPLPVAGVSGVSGVSEGYWCCIFLVQCVAFVR